MLNARTARLAVSVSEISLTACLETPGDGKHQDPLFLLFAGAVETTAPDFKGDVWDLPTQMEKRAVAVRCISTPRQSATRRSPHAVGWCQFCPIARDLDVSVEIDCCPKLFHLLKNTAGFGGGQAGAGITLILDVAEENGGDVAGSSAVVRLAVTRLAVTASRTLTGAAPPFVRNRGSIPPFHRGDGDLKAFDPPGNRPPVAPLVHTVWAPSPTGQIPVIIWPSPSRPFRKRLRQNIHSLRRFAPQ